MSQSDQSPRPVDPSRSQPSHRAAVETPPSVTHSRRTLAVVIGVALVALGMPTALAVSGVVSGASRVKASKLAAAPDELVVNGGFENASAGWKVNRSSTQLLATGLPAQSGSAAAQLASTTLSSVVVNDKAPTVASTTAGRSYRVSAYVRSTGAELRGKVRVRELTGSGSAQSFASFRADSRSWSFVEFTYTSATSGAKVDLNVVARKVAPGTTLLVDGVSMVQTSSGAPSSSATSSSATASASPSPTRTTSSAPSSPTSSSAPSAPTSSTSAPTTPPSGGCVSNAMGIPAAGNTYLGAAVSGGITVEQREKQLGRTLRIRRTYYSSGQIDSAVRTATSDLAAGRLPWISFKAPKSWSAMASGDGDAWATQLADGLKKVPGPVWLAIHHEPEKDGDLSQWTAMQRRIAPIIHARTNNVAYTVIYSGWNTFGGGSNTLASKWPGDAHIDITAIDAYNDYAVKRGGRIGDKHLDIKSYYVKLAAWAKAHGTAWGVAEMGQSVAAAKDDPTWLTRAYHDMESLGGAGLSYFDSDENSVTDWGLDDPIKFQQFKALLAESPRVC